MNQKITVEHGDKHSEAGKSINLLVDDRVAPHWLEPLHY